MLVAQADRLVTLTPGAAGEITRRWGCTATVLPHPHVVEIPRLARARPSRPGFRVGVHAKSLRPNMSVLPVVRALSEAVCGLSGAELVVNIHREVADPSAHAYSPGALAELETLAARGRLELQVHDYFDDDQLWDYLSDLDVSVLPYTFGTHSGWLEACHDLGTTVIAPSCGFYSQQRPCLSYGHTQREGLDEESLREALVTAYRTRPAWRATVAGRTAERVRVGAAHRALYTELLE